MRVFLKPSNRLAVMKVAVLTLTATQSLAQVEEQSGEIGLTQEEVAAIAAGQEDTVVARVGPVDIRTTDVMRQIGMMPDRFRSQPPEMLIPMAVEQLVLRQLILQEAGTQELATDPQVQVLAEEAAQTARENVLVQVWLDRELEGRVSDEDVQAMYEELQTNSDAELPPLDQVRGQIEQRLRQQEVQTLTQELLESDLVVFYGPDGAPVDSTVIGNGSGEAGADTGSDASTSPADEAESGSAEEEAGDE